MQNKIKHLIHLGLSIVYIDSIETYIEFALTPSRINKCKIRLEFKNSRREKKTGELNPIRVRTVNKKYYRFLF